METTCPPDLSEGDFCRGIFAALARRGVQRLPDHNLDPRMSYAAMVTYEILEQFFQDIVTPRLYITTSPHGFAGSWIVEVRKLWFTHYMYDHGNACINLEVQYLCSRGEDYVPGPRYMWDFLAACFADALEERDCTVAVIKIPSGHEGEYGNIVTLLLDTVEQMNRDTDDDERLKVLLVGEDTELNYRAISNQLRMSQRFYNFNGDGFDQRAKTYVFRPDSAPRPR